METCKGGAAHQWRVHIYEGTCRALHVHFMATKSNLKVYTRDFVPLEETCFCGPDPGYKVSW